MGMSEVDRTIGNLLDWIAGGKWSSRFEQVQEVHFCAAADMLGIEPVEVLDALGDASNVLNAFILEDFFTERFGEHAELNVLDDYLDQRGWRESDPGRQYLEALRDSNASLYEVVDINPGSSLTLRDLIVPGEPLTVHERQGSRTAAVWDRVAARIVPLNGEIGFTGAVLHFRYEAVNDVLSGVDRIVKKESRQLGRRSRRRSRGHGKRRRPSPGVSPIERETIVRSLPCAEMLAQVWLLDTVSQALAPMPELRNTDDEPIVLCEIRFPILGDIGRISSALDEIETFDRVTDAEAQWVWHAPGSPSRRAVQHKKGNPTAKMSVVSGTTSLGHVRIEDGVVTLNANSRERAERGEALLSSRLGDLVGPALISSQDPYQAMRERSSRPAPDDLPDPFDEGVQAIHAHLDEHYRQTLDDPLPMLGGRTLRQAAKTKKGREEAIDWLKQLENMEYRRASKQGHSAYDTRWIWEELGIGRSR